jgi:hypothetical protein
MTMIIDGIFGSTSQIPEEPLCYSPMFTSRISHESTKPPSAWAMSSLVQNITCIKLPTTLA